MVRFDTGLPCRARTRHDQEEAIFTHYRNREPAFQTTWFPLTTEIFQQTTTWQRRKAGMFVYLWAAQFEATTVIYRQPFPWFFPLKKKKIIIAI